MKNSKKIIALLLMLAMMFLAAGCGETSQSAAQSQQPKEQEPAAEEEPSTPAAEEQTEAEFISPDGWRIIYDPRLVECSESGSNGALFIYTGESAGANLVEVFYVPDKQPEEALYDLTSSWGDQADITRSEGIFPGTDDKWGYWRFLPMEKNYGTSRTAIAGQYHSGSLLFDISSSMGEDEAQNMLVSDTLSGIIDSITYPDGFGPQDMYSYYPGVYRQVGGETDYSVVLKDDHTGWLHFQDSKDILWGSVELTDVLGSFSYEFTIEGDSLYVNMDGDWVEFEREVSAEDYPGNWAEKISERVVISITPAEEDGWFDVLVTWREDLPQKDVYTMKAQYQTDGSLYYEDCLYVIRTFGEDGSYEDEEQYRDGSGLFWYDRDEEVLYWTDYEVEDKEERVQTFIRVDYEI